MTKKLLALAAVCILTASLAACGTKETRKTSEAPAQSETQSGKGQSGENQDGRPGTGSSKNQENTPNQNSASESADDVNTSGEASRTEVPSPLDDAVSSAILAGNSAWYPSNECAGEGHIILGTKENGSMFTVYALTIYGGYGFEDGNFVKSAGTGVLPVTIDFTVNENGDYELANYHVPLDGSLYEGSIRQMFPAEYQERCLSPSEEDKKELERQERLYAENYLKFIGRTAEIGEYSDFEHPLLTSLGVSVEISNALSGKGILEHYPYWIGNTEQLEDGLRYVYQMEYTAGSPEIIFTKSEYDSKKTVQELRYSSLTGVLTYMEPAPSGDGSGALLEELGLKNLRGVIEDVNDGHILVTVDSGEEIKSYASKIYFHLDKTRQGKFQKGTHVEIIHDGSFLESDPPIGNLISIYEIK